MSPYSIFWRDQGLLYTEYTFDPFDMSKISNITLYTVLGKSSKHHLTLLTWVTWVTIKFSKAYFDPFDIISHIALIHCIDYSFNVHTTDKVKMSGFLTI